VFTRARHRSLSWKWIQSIPFQISSCKIHFNIILRSTLRTCKCSLPFRFVLPKLQAYAFLVSPMRITRSALLPSYLIILKMTGEGCKLWSSSFGQCNNISHTPATSSHLSLNISSARPRIRDQFQLFHRNINGGLRDTRNIIDLLEAYLGQGKGRGEGCFITQRNVVRGPYAGRLRILHANTPRTEQRKVSKYEKQKDNGVC
jgi:hypothetical protein